MFLERFYKIFRYFHDKKIPRRAAQYTKLHQFRVLEKDLLYKILS